MNEPWMWIFFGIPSLFILLFYANFIYHAKKAKKKGKKLDRKGWLLIFLGYVAMMLTGFYMWFTELAVAFTHVYSTQRVEYESMRLYVMIGHLLVFIPALLAFGCAHGKKLFYVSVALIIAYMYMYELGTFRITYCEHVNPMSTSNQEMDLKITREEKEFLTYYTDSKISPYMRARVKCEMNFPLNPFIYNSDRTSMW